LALAVPRIRSVRLDPLGFLGHDRHCTSPFRSSKASSSMSETHHAV
jgi:hypothetical protein